MILVVVAVVRTMTTTNPPPWAGRGRRTCACGDVALGLHVVFVGGFCASGDAAEISLSTMVS